MSYSTRMQILLGAGLAALVFLTLLVLENQLAEAAKLAV